jgi:hypothetical protein
MINLATHLYLEQFHQVHAPFVEGDNTATTFDCMGAVLLARAHSNSSSALELAFVTGLPIDFIIAALRKADLMELWSSDRYICLITALQQNPTDFGDVADALSCVQEMLWNRHSIPEMGAMERHRNGFLVGGRRQWWFDVENHPVG